ncbi:4891_t:CDS:10 [Entrophospora sp. SA101]|nr:4891_t:CDS:10 [Entrophospora sp. SA101]
MFTGTFRTSEQPVRFVLENVYLNELHALRRFEISNISQYTILVKLRSNLGSQIAFQLSNENLPDLDSRDACSPDLPTSLSENPLTNITTNTVAAAAFGAFCDNVNGYKFNQLFNYVNHIDEVEIPPSSSQKVILAFLPEPLYKAQRSEMNHSSELQSTDNVTGPTTSDNNQDDTEETTGDSNIFATSTEDETYDFFEVNGLLFFFVYIIDNINSDIDNSSKHNETQNLISNRTSSPSINVTYYSENDQVNNLNKIIIDNSIYRDVDNISNTNKADYQVTIKFHSTVCKSVLWTDVGETGINFDDCVNGGTYFKDFTIWNRSEIELYWLLNTVDLTNSKSEDMLKFTDYDTGEPLDSKPIPSYSHRRIRVTFRPKEIGEFSYDLQLENANDPSNVLQSRIHAVVRSVLREELLVVSSVNNILDFGDCCAGVWSKQQLVLKNVSEVPLEIHFGAENAEVQFHLKTDDLIINYNRFDIDESRTSYHQITGIDVSSPTNTLINTSSTSEISRAGSEISSRTTSPTPPIQESDKFDSSSGISSLLINNQLKFQTSGLINRSFENSINDSDLEPFVNNSLINEQSIKGLSDNYELYPDSPDGLAQIEEVVFGPGKESTVQVSYRPEKDASANNYKAGILTRRTFRIILKYSPLNLASTSLSSNEQERKIIQCRARSCTSFVKVSPKEVNFGDTDVGTLKSIPITIYNLSELTARVKLEFVSKVLNCIRNEIVIPPKLSTEIKLDMYPRKVNVDYRKQITVVNLQNRDNDQIIEVHTTNIDKNRVTFHSLFYRILTSTGSNFIDFGTTVVNSPNIRTFTIDNISTKKLILEITSSWPEEILIYQKHPKAEELSQTINPLLDNINDEDIVNGNIESETSRSKLERREKLLESIRDRRLSKKHHINNIETTSTSGISLTNTLVDEFHSVVSNKRHASHAFLDNSITDISSSSSAAYLDLAGSPNLDPKHSPRKRPLKTSLSKTSGMGVNNTIERINKNINPVMTNSISSTAISFYKKNSINTTTHLIRNSGFNLNENNVADTTKENTEGLQYKESNNNNIGGIVSSATHSKVPPDSSRFSCMTLDTLISTLETNNPTSPLLFPKSTAEEAHVRRHIELLLELEKRIRDQQLVSVRMVEISPSSECQIIVISTPKSHIRSNVQGSPKKYDAKVFLRLIDFDREIQQPQFESLLHGDQSQIPVRELMVNVTLCQSIMDLGQKNINFGNIDKHERRKKTIIIQNRSEIPLLYNIRKSGSIASGDIVFRVGKSGVVRGYGKKEVEFTFNPSLAGQFHEKLMIENVQDRDNNQVLSLKAIVRKQSNFTIQPLNINFGVCLINESCTQVQQITICNTNKQSRMFEVRVDPLELKFSWFIAELNFFVPEEKDGNSNVTGIISKEMEEEIESLEQKVKIARRKGHEEKVKKLEKKLANLRRGEAGGEIIYENEPLDNDDIRSLNDSKEERIGIFHDGKSTSSEEIPGIDSATMTNRKLFHAENFLEKQYSRTSNNNSNVGQAKEANKYKKTSSSIIFSINSRSSKTISVYFRAIRINVQTEFDDSLDADQISQEIINGRIFVHEYKNTDVTKHVNFKAVVCNDHSRTVFNSTNEAVDLEFPGKGKVTSSSSLSMLQQGQSHLISSPALQGFDTTSTAFTNISPVIELPQFQLSEHIGLEIQNLLLEPKVLDIGRLEINQSHNYYFKLFNKSDTTLKYEIIIPEKEQGFFFFEKIIDSLSPNDIRRVDFTVIANSVGHQAHSLIIHNCVTNSELSFTLHGYVHYPRYLRFPSLGDDGQSVLNLGYCYVDPGRKFSQVAPLIVENITEDDVYITCQSNLSLQVSVFLDENGEKGQVVETLLKKKSMMTVWVALQPNLLGGIPTTSRRTSSINANNTGSLQSVTGTTNLSDRNAIANGECRVLIGGIKFSVQVLEGIPSISPSANFAQDIKGQENKTESYTVITQTVKFTSLIGLSTLSVSKTLINLGTTKKLGGIFYGSFDIRNVSSRLPLDYSVECLSGNIILDCAGGSLEGWELKGTSEVEVRLFVDNEDLCFLTKDNQQLLKGNNNLERALLDKENDKLSSIEWNNISVTIAGPSSETQNFDLDVSNCEMNLKAIIQKGYQAKTVPLYEQCIEISNQSTTKTLKIFPTSDLAVQVRWAPFGEVKIIEMFDNEVSDKSQIPFKICGKLIELKPGNKAHLYLSCPQPNFLSSEEINTLATGRKVTVKGTLFLNDQNQDMVVKMVNLIAAFCVPKGEININYIDLGKIGLSNSWAGIKFQFTLCNISDIPLNYELQSPDCIEILDVIDDSSTEVNHSVVSLKHKVEPHIDQTITAVLKPHRIENYAPGEQLFVVNILNMFNPLNIMTLKVKATLTSFELMFDRLIQGDLVLPILYHPISFSDHPCDEWFTIFNITDQDIRFEIGAELAPDISSFLKIEILSRFSNTPLVGGVSICAHGSIEVRVRAYPIETKRIPRESLYLTNQDGVTFGKLWVATKQANNEDDKTQRIEKTITIRGVIAESVIFTISPKKLFFKTEWISSDNELNNEIIKGTNRSFPGIGSKTQLSQDDSLDSYSTEEDLIQRDHLIITNISSKLPLYFKVQVEGPMELSVNDIINIFPLDENNCGVVEAKQKLILGIELVDTSAVVSEDIKIHIIDLKSLSEQKKTIVVKIESDTREHRSKVKKEHWVEEGAETISEQNNDTVLKLLANSLDKSLQHLDHSPSLPFIILRGCKRIGEVTEIGGRYELDLGQQDLGSPTITKKLTLENSTHEKISYHIKTVFANDKNWLNISRIEGTLESSTGEHHRQYNNVHTITLSFLTNTRNVYSTYVIIKNMSNPSDTKTIRVMMEIVARQNIKRGVNVSLENNNVFDVYVNGVDISQSWIEMLNLFYGTEYTARSMVIYNRESVPLEFTFQTNLDYDDPTEIVFSTSRMSAKLFKTLTVEPESNVRVYICVRPLPSQTIQESLQCGEQRDTNLVEEKNIEIYVNCRLVKDFQKIIMLKAECRMPSLQVTYCEMEALMGKIHHNESDNKDEDEWIINFDPEYREITITNLLDSPLEYEIVNDTMYFTLEFSNNKKKVDPKSSHNVIVRPNLKSLAKNIESVRREKYIQENMTVYNRNRPSENYWIPLRISFGYISNFQLASGYKVSYAFSVLENHTVCFLSDFNRNIQLFDLLKQKPDELVYYATIKTGENWFQLAGLLFGTILSNNIFQKHGPLYLKRSHANHTSNNEQGVWSPELAKWVAALNYFISFFPYRNPMLETLKELHKNMIIIPPSAISN